MKHFVSNFTHKMTQFIMCAISRLKTTKSSQKYCSCSPICFHVRRAMVQLGILLLLLFFCCRQIWIHGILFFLLISIYASPARVCIRANASLCNKMNINLRWILFIQTISHEYSFRCGFQFITRFCSGIDLILLHIFLLLFSPSLAHLSSSPSSSATTFGNTKVLQIHMGL